jgi:imidazolonepropionase-like amidohydrolase
MTRLLTLALAWTVLTSAVDSYAQDGRERRGGFRPSIQVVRNARIVPAAGEPPIEKGTLVIRNGVIVAVGDKVETPPGAQVIDGEGLVVYPGFIDALAEAALPQDRQPVPAAGRNLELDQYALAATPPDNRRGLTPEFLLSSRLPWDENAQKKLREAGITSAHLAFVHPIASGLSCWSTTSGRPLRESLIRDEAASLLMIAPPPRRDGEATQYPSTHMGAVAHLRQAFLDAEHHALHKRLFNEGAPNIARPFDDPALDALARLSSGDQTSLFLTRYGTDRDRRDDDPGSFGFLPSNTEADRIRRAILFAQEHKLRPILSVGLGATDAMESLKSAEFPLIVELDLEDEPESPKVKEAAKGELPVEVKLPTRQIERVRDEWKKKAQAPTELHKAGLTFAFATRGLKQPTDLLKTVRILMENGLPADAALAALTSSPAELLGHADHLGALREGKWGHVTILSAPLGDKSAKLRYLLVDGAEFEFNRPEKSSGEKPSEKPTVQLDGRWTVQIAQGADKTTRATIELTQNDSKLSGTFTSDDGTGRIEDGLVSGAKVKFTVAIGVGEKSLKLKFEGEATTADGKTTLSGKLTPPFGAETTWTATPESSKSEEKKTDEPQKPANPVALALDDAPASEEKKPKTPDKPAEKSATDAPLTLETLPTELPSDRLQRPDRTGGSLFIRGGTVLTGTGETIENASILIRGGKIAAIGGELEPDEGMEVLNAEGCWIIPGMIDTHSHIMFDGGLEHVNEGTQSIVCEVRVSDVIATRDPNEYRALAGGLTTARLLHGSANCIGGQDAAVKLKVGDSVQDHLLKDRPVGVKFALGENVKRLASRFPHSRLGVEATLKRAFFEALDYRRQWQEFDRAKAAAGDKANQLLPPRRDLRLDLLVSILNHETLIHSHCYRADEILMLLRTAESLSFRVQSLQHVLEGYKIAPEIKKHGASCSTFADWWAYKVEAYDATAYNASLLNEAGINTVIKSDNAELMRHMNLEAAKSLKYGNMPADDALRMVTINAARELGLDKRIGSLAPGKDADIAIFNGHPLSTFARCVATVIEGEIRYRQASQPTTMSAAAAKRTRRASALVMAGDETRAKSLEIPTSESGLYAIENATLHPVEGKIDAIEHGTLIVRDGKIEAFGQNVPAPDGATIVNATGLHVYPGLIDAGCLLGIHEIDALDVTKDEFENGPFQPDLVASTAVNVDSELLPVARAGGITSALLRPRGGTIAGQCSLIQTAGWTSREMTLREAVGLAVNWPNKAEEVTALKEFVKASRQYDELRKINMPGVVVRDPRYEAMRPYLNRSKPVFIEAHSRKHMAEALNWAADEKLRVILTGATDAWKLGGELKARKIPVIVGPVMRRPMEEWDTFDAPYANPGRLFENGVTLAIRSDEEANSRNAPLEAGFAVGYGLPEKEALKAVTLTAARILGVDKELGSLKAGKRASLILTDGSPLQHSTQFKAIFVDGKPYAPESRQTRFYNKYRERLSEAQN